VKQEKIRGLGRGKCLKSFPINAKNVHSIIKKLPSKFVFYIGPEEIEAVKKNSIILWF